MRTCPSCWSETSPTWRTGGRWVRRRPKLEQISGASATWRLPPRPGPMWTRYADFTSLKTCVLSSRFCLDINIRFNTFLLLGVFRPHAWNPSQENGGRQRERERQKEELNQEDSGKMLYFIMTGFIFLFPLWCHVLLFSMSV